MTMTAQQRAEKLQEVLDKLAAGQHVSGCALLTNEGLVVCHTFPAPWVEGAGELGSGLWAAGTRFTGALGLADAREAVVSSDSGTAVIRPAGHHHVLLLVAPARSSLGIVRVAADQAANTIRQVLAPAPD